MALPIKRVRPHTANKKKKTQYDSVILNWTPINVHGFLQKAMLIDLKDYWVSTRYEYEPHEEGKPTRVKRVFHTVMFRYRKDAKRFSFVADPGRM